MKGAGLAAGLLLATLAFALAFVPRRIAWASACMAIVLMTAVALSTRQLPDVIAFTGWGACLIAIALSVYWPRAAQRYAALPLAAAAAAGAWSGILLAGGQRSAVLALAAGLTVMVLASTAIAARGWDIALRVATSWLLAVALLVGAIPYLVAHPGFAPDHRE